MTFFLFFLFQCWGVYFHTTLAVSDAPCPQVENTITEYVLNTTEGADGRGYICAQCTECIQYKSHCTVYTDAICAFPDEVSSDYILMLYIYWGFSVINIIYHGYNLLHHEKIE